MFICVGIAFASSFQIAFEKSGKKMALFLDKKIPGKVIAIMPFVTKSKEKSVLLSDIYAYYLRNTSLKIVDRKELSSVLKEIKLSMAGITNDKNAKKIGELAGADYLLTGNMELLANIYYVNVKVIEVATGETIYSDMLTIQDKAFMTIENFEEYLAERKYPSTALFRSTLIPGWGQLYNDQPVKAGLFGGMAVISLGADIYLYNMYQKYVNNTDEGEAYSEDLQKAKKYNSYLLISAGITLSVWVANMLDAYISAMR